MSIPLIILAAGKSTRLGKPKQFVSFHGKTLIENCVAAGLASSCDPVLIVAGDFSEQIKDLFKGVDVQIVANDRWNEGVASSIRAGLSSALVIEPKAEAVVLSVCDQPLITAEVFDALVHSYRASFSKIVASAYADTLGVPALFDRSLFAELSSLSGDTGAKRIIVERADSAAAIEFSGGAIDIDSDTDLMSLSYRVEHTQA